MDVHIVQATHKHPQTEVKDLHIPKPFHAEKHPVLSWTSSYMSTPVIPGVHLFTTLLLLAIGLTRNAHRFARVPCRPGNRSSHPHCHHILVSLPHGKQTFWSLPELRLVVESVLESNVFQLVVEQHKLHPSVSSTEFHRRFRCSWWYSVSCW